MTVRAYRAVLAAAATAVALGASFAAQAQELLIPSMDYRTGPYAPSGIPLNNGWNDYFSLLNERDGGIEGVKLRLEPCETAYNTQQGVECYEKLKGTPPTGALMFSPFSTGIVYQVIPKSAVDKIPLLTSGYGRTSAADGTVFPWVFNAPATYWSEASAIVNYIGQREGGMDKLKGKKIYIVYHNSAYGKEPLPTLEALQKKHGYEFKSLAVDHPGQEQKATWLQIRNEKPDYVILWGWGVMNQVAIKEASSIRFPMNKLIGGWWSNSEADVKPTGAAAKGYIAANFSAVGGGFPVHKDILKYVYEKGKAVDPSFKDRIGEVLHNRGILAAMYTAEAIRNAMKIHNTKQVTGEQLRDGFEALDITEARLKELGMEGLTFPIKITCANHEGHAKISFIEWQGDAFKTLPGYYEPDREVVDGLIKADSAAYAKENNITPRTCK